MKLALYRKYRPKTLGDIVGQEANTMILKNAARKGRLGHAYLLYGPRGTGKTSTARLIAKLLNCEELNKNQASLKEGEPCNRCIQCDEIDRGTALDLIEIDAASNRGIDEIRNLKEGIGVTPVKGRFKTYIIDEAHMLTREASNALLKTLEEPPAHAVLILATTEYEKLPATITSRTQRFLFKKLPKTKIIEKLARIAKEEGIDAEPAALDLIATAGEGSLRDAESLLDQVSSFERKIDVALIEGLTGRIGFAKIRRIAELIAEKNLKDALVYLTEVHEEGYNVVELTKNLIHYLRKTLAFKMNPDIRRFFETELTKEELAHLEKLAARIEVNSQIALIKSLIRAYGEMRYSPFQTVPLEIALIEHLKG